jgi:hypothetical protein
MQRLDKCSSGTRKRICVKGKSVGVVVAHRIDVPLDHL